MSAFVYSLREKFGRQYGLTPLPNADEIDKKILQGSDVPEKGDRSPDFLLFPLTKKGRASMRIRCRTFVSVINRVWTLYSGRYWGY